MNEWTTEKWITDRMNSLIDPALKSKKDQELPIKNNTSVARLSLLIFPIPINQFSKIFFLSIKRHTNIVLSFLQK